MNSVYDAVGVMTALMMLAVGLIVTGWYMLAYTMGDRYSYRALAITCTAFQVGHLAEHGLQLGAWFSDPTAQPWMSPVAWSAERGLAIIGRHPGNMAVGMEMLHFLGNWIFLVGLMAWASQFSNKWLTFALRLQGLHVLEHVVLTVTVFVHGSPIGLSTLLGYGVTLIGTEWSAAYRIWFHFLANMVATCAVFKALAEWRRLPQSHKEELLVSHG